MQLVCACKVCIIHVHLRCRENETIFLSVQPWQAGKHLIKFFISPLLEIGLIVVGRGVGGGGGLIFGPVRIPATSE